MSISLSFSNTTFTSWVIHQTNNSTFLNPPAYKLRPISDKGCINDSLESSKIDLFDRTPVPIRSDVYLLKKITRFALNVLSGIGLPFSICHHMALSLVHFVSLPFQDEKKEAWNKVLHYAKIFFYEMIQLASFGLAVGSMGMISSIILSPIKAVSLSGKIDEIFLRTMLVLFGSLICTAEEIFRLGLSDPSRSFCSDARIAEMNFSRPLSPDDSYGYNKALFLRNEFGVVDPNNNILSWDPNKDQDVEFFQGEKKYIGMPGEAVKLLLDDVRDLKYKPVGYFSKVCITQKLKFNTVVKLLMKSISLREEIDSIKKEAFLLECQSLMNKHIIFQKNLSTQAVISTLMRYQDELGFDANEIEFWTNALQTWGNNAETSMEFIENTYEKCYVASREKSRKYDPFTRTTTINTEVVRLGGINL